TISLKCSKPWVVAVIPARRWILIEGFGARGSIRVSNRKRSPKAITPHRWRSLTRRVPITGRSTSPKRLAFLKNCAKRWKKSGKIFSVEKSNLNKFSMTVRSTRVMENIRYLIFRSENSFPLDGGRACPELAEGSRWGCKKDYQASLPLSSPVQGEEIKSRSDLHRLRTHRLHTTIIFLSLLFFERFPPMHRPSSKKLDSVRPDWGRGSCPRISQRSAAISRRKDWTSMSL